MRIILSIFLYLFLSFSKFSIAQNTKINIQDFHFIEEKIRKNYPAYKEKYNDRYKNMLTIVKQNILQEADSVATFQELIKPVMFFKDLHMRLQSTKPIYFYSIFCEKKMKEINGKIKNSKSKYEGYWLSDYNDHIIYLQSSQKRKDSYLEAVVIESANKSVKRGSIKFYITRNKIDKYNITNYISSKGIMAGVYSYFPATDTLITGLQSRWSRIKDYYPGYLSKYIPIEDQVELKLLDTNTIAIKIPRSDFSAKSMVDSLVKVNKALIEKTPNLIIDVRNNTGGSWGVYGSLFPYIFTNPIITGEQFRYCADDFIEKQRERVEQESRDSSQIESYVSDKEFLDSMIKYRGSFIYLKPDTIMFDSIKMFPRKVIILTNYRCISATEMFIKMCQQSKKVIIAGERTWGAIDNVGVITFDSPTGNYKLLIPRTKNFYGKTPPLDFMGINPDINIPPQESDGYHFINNYLNYTYKSE